MEQRRIWLAAPIVPGAAPGVILSAAKDLARWAELLRGVDPECNEWAQHDNTVPYYRA